jgi:hypothetical protein
MKDNVVRMIPRQHHNKKGIKRASKILCLVLSFVLSITFVALAILFVVQWTCFNKNTFYKNLLSSKYYENVLSDLYEKAEAITLPTGLSIEVLKDTIELYEVHRDVNGYLEAGFRGEAFEADTSKLESDLKQNIDQYLKSEGIMADLEQRKNIELYVTSIATEYKKSIEIPLLDFLVSLREFYKKIYYTGIVICTAVIATIIRMMTKMNGWLHRTIRYLTYSTTAAAFMVALAPFVALCNGFYRRIQLSPRSLYDFTVIFVTNIFHTFLLFGLVLATISIVLMITVKGIKYSLIKK